MHATYLVTRIPFDGSGLWPPCPARTAMPSSRANYHLALLRFDAAADNTCFLAVDLWMMLCTLSTVECGFSISSRIMSSSSDLSAAAICRAIATSDIGSLAGDEIRSTRVSRLWIHNLQKPSAPPKESDRTKIPRVTSSGPATYEVQQCDPSISYRMLPSLFPLRKS